MRSGYQVEKGFRINHKISEQLEGNSSYSCLDLV